MDAIDAKALPARPNLEQYKKQAKDLLKATRSADADALRRISVEQPTAEPWTLASAQFAIAREHGFTSWPKFAQHIAGLADGPTKRYEAAVDAIVAGAVGTLQSLLDSDPELVRRRSTRVHAATLLHYVAANGVEQYRQKSPSNAVEIADLLLARGSEPDALATIYTDTATTMELLVSSVHPAAAGVQVDLVHTLIDAGSAPNGPADDGGPLLTAVLFQYVPAANALVDRGARIDTVVTAAGLGRSALVREMVSANGTLRPGVRLARVGVPRPRQDPVANLGWALGAAAGLGHPDIVDFLAGCGADLATRTFAGFTPLHWAAVNAHLEVVEVLLSHGADLEDAANYHHSTVLGCARWAAGQGLPDAPAIIDRLLAAGARPD